MAPLRSVPWVPAAGCSTNSASGSSEISPEGFLSCSLLSRTLHDIEKQTQAIPYPETSFCLFSLLFVFLPKEACCFGKENFLEPLILPVIAQHLWLCSKDTAFHFAFPCILEAVQLPPGKCSRIAVGKWLLTLSCFLLVFPSCFLVLRMLHKVRHISRCLVLFGPGKH